MYKNYNLKCQVLAGDLPCLLYYHIFHFSLKSLFIVYPHILTTYKGRALTLLLQCPIGLINREILNVDINLLDTMVLEPQHNTPIE